MSLFVKFDGTPLGGGGTWYNFISTLCFCTPRVFFLVLRTCEAGPILDSTVSNAESIASSDTPDKCKVRFSAENFTYCVKVMGINRGVYYCTFGFGTIQYINNIHTEGGGAKCGFPLKTTFFKNNAGSGIVG